MIPGKLWHIWLSDKPEGELAQKCVASWETLGYPLEHITLENCDRGEPFVRQALDAGAIEGRVKANDFLRVKYLYDHGGIYMDNDVEVLKPFGDLMRHACFLGAEDRQQVNMAVLGSEPGNWFLRECLEEMRKFRGDGPESPVAFSLGTTTTILRRHGWHAGGHFEKLGVAVYPPETFYPVHWTKSVGEAGGRNTEAYTVHHWNQSWNATVSVVIPCFNYGKYLRECLDSVFAQTYPDIEVIVVDDGSTDDTKQVCGRYPKVRYVYQENKGLSAARNAGIRHAKGQYIQPLDADDRLGPTAIEQCVKLLDSADIACPGQQEFERGNRFYARTGWNFSLATIIKGNRLHCASMFRRKAWIAAGGYDETMRDGFEDWDFWVRVIASGFDRIRVIDEPLFFYRVHTDSMLRRMGATKQTAVMEYMRAKYAKLGYPVKAMAVAP